MVRVVLGVTGSVAGIKVAELVQELSNRGAEVRIASSKHGAVFLNQPQQGQAPPVYYTDEDDYKQVFQKAMLQNGDLVHCSESDAAKTSKESCDGTIQELGKPLDPLKQASKFTSHPLHVELAEWGEVLLIAPLSANTLAKIALGLCDSLVSRIVRCWQHSKASFVAPAMNTKMWNHAGTSRHLKEVEGFGMTVISPVSKTLACGDVGIGAMASVQSIVSAVLQ